MSVWIDSSQSSGIEIDELASGRYYEEFLRVVENCLLSNDPNINLPSINHLQLLAQLAVLQTTQYNALGNKFVTSDLDVSRYSLKLLSQIWNLVQHGSRVINRTEAYSQFVNAFKIVEKEENNQVSKRLKYRSKVHEDSRYKASSDDEVELCDELNNDDEDMNESSDKGSVNLELDLKDIGIDLSDDEFNDEEYDLTEKMPVFDNQPIEPLFDSHYRIWELIGWAFTCSTISDPYYFNRWQQYKPFLEFLIILLENNFMSAPVSEHSVVYSWIQALDHVTIIESILAVLPQKLKLKFEPVFAKERPVKSMKLPEAIEPRVDQDAVMLRSRFLKLVISACEKESRVPFNAEELIEACDTHFNSDWIRSVLIGDPHCLSRIALSRTLNPKLRKEYVLLNPHSADIDRHLMMSVLYPDLNSIGKTMYVFTFENLMLMIVDIINHSSNSSYQQKELRQMYDEGAKGRKKWLQSISKSVSKQDYDKMLLLDQDLDEFVYLAL